MFVCGNEICLSLRWHLNSPYFFSYNLRGFLFNLCYHILISLLLGDASANMLLVGKDVFNIFIVKFLFYLLEIVVATVVYQVILNILFIQLEA
jgi:hypothetical protein